MKTILIAITALFLSTNTMAQGIEFEHGTFAEALAKAKKENKMVFMDCYTSWCGPCKMIAKNVFPQKEVGDVFNKQFVNFKIDCEKGEGPEIAKRYGVNAYPTMLFFDANGQVVHKIVGGTDVAGIIKHAGIAADPSKQLGALQKQYEGGNREIEFLSDYVYALQSAYKQEELQAVGKEFLANTTNENLISVEAFTIIAYSGSLEYGSDAWKCMIANKAKFVAMEGIGQEGYNYVLGQSVSKYLQDKARTSETLEAFKAEMAAVKKEFNSPQLEGMESSFISTYYLTHNETEKWFNLQVKMAEEVPNKQMSGRILDNALNMISYQPPKADSDLYGKVIAVAENMIKENSHYIRGYHVLAIVYATNGNKEKAQSNFYKYAELLQKRGIAIEKNPKAKSLKEQIDAM